MRIHFIAIGGAIMHSLAIELHKNGHLVTGSDDLIYDPAKSNLSKHNLLPKYDGWNDSFITPDKSVLSTFLDAFSILSTILIFSPIF